MADLLIDNGLRQWCPRCLKATPTITDENSRNRCAECPDRVCVACLASNCVLSDCTRKTCLCPCTTYVEA